MSDKVLSFRPAQREDVAVLQMTFIPYLTYQGGWRALIEGVRVSSKLRGEGVGGTMFEWAIARARERGCHVVQLRPTSPAPTRSASTRHSGSKRHTRA